MYEAANADFGVDECSRVKLHVDAKSQRWCGFSASVE